MNVKSLYPIIVTEDVDATVAFYSNLGFSTKHNLTTKFGSCVKVLSNGELELEVIEAPKAGGPATMKPGFYGMRMNVADLDAAMAELKEKGCEIVAGPIPTESGKNLLIKDNNGINITLIQHIKK